MSRDDLRNSGAMRATAVALALLVMAEPAMAITVPCYSKNLAIDWKNGGLSYDFEKTFVDSMTGTSESILVNSTATLGNTVTVGGLRDGNISTSLWNPYFRLEIEAKTPPTQQAIWETSGSLGLYSDLANLERSYAYFRGGVGRGYMELFYEARYEIGSQTFTDKTTVGLVGACVTYQFYTADSAASVGYNCDFDTIEVTSETSMVPVPAGAGLLFGGLATLTGLRRFGRRG